MSSSASACEKCVMEYMGDTLVYLDDAEYTEWIARYRCAVCKRIEYRDITEAVIDHSRVDVVKDV